MLKSNKKLVLFHLKVISKWYSPAAYILTSNSYMNLK
jgi:hypothetical protein